MIHNISDGITLNYSDSFSPDQEQGPMMGLYGILLVLAILYTCFKRLRGRVRKNSIAFFHLYCSSGGGGERVLWNAIYALLRKYKSPEHCPTIYIYSHKSIPQDKHEVLKKVRDQFKIDLISEKNLAKRLEFIPLRLSNLIEAKKYPFLTLLMQSIGSIIVACEAAYHLVPELYIETIGFSFTLPVFKLLGSKVMTYVHYPIISNDMIQNVKTSSHASFNNREIFTRSPALRNAKLIYYRIFAFLYRLAGSRADCILVNSSWTQNHINSLWKTSAHVVYPPCDVDSFKQLCERRTRVKTSRSLNIISIAQFRPEKNHLLQIEAFNKFLEITGETSSKLTLYGGCRDEEDQKRVGELREHINRLNLDPQVDIVVNAPFERLLDGLQDANVAMHTMKDEHFGIVLVEFMAAGLITVAHNSGGPREDIIDDNENGFLASDLEEFSLKLKQISGMAQEERQKMSFNARMKAEKFSIKRFESDFIKWTE